MLWKVRNLITSRFGKDILITVTGQVIVLITAFGLNKLLSIQLGVVGYGEYSIIKKVAGVLTFFMLASMGIAIPKYLASLREIGDKKKEARFVVSVLMLITILSLATIIIIYLFKVPFAKLLFGKEGFSSYILPILLYSFSLTLTNFAYAYFRGLEKFYKYSLSQIFVQLTTLIIALIFGGSILTLLYSWSIIIGIYGVSVFIQAWRHYYPMASINSFKNDLKSSFKELMVFSLPRVPGELTLFSFTLVPLIIINQRFGMEVTAYFAVSTTINNLITPFFSFVGLVLLPLVSRSIVSDQFSKADEKVKMLGKIYLIIGVIGIAIVGFFTKTVVTLLFSSEFQSSIPIVRIIIFAVLPNAIYLLLRNPLDAASKIPYNTINLIISFLLLNVLMLVSTSTTAIAVSFVASYSLLGALSIWSWYKCRKDIYLTSK